MGFQSTHCSAYVCKCIGLRIQCTYRQTKKNIRIHHNNLPPHVHAMQWDEYVGSQKQQCSRKKIIIAFIMLVAKCSVSASNCVICYSICKRSASQEGIVKGLLWKNEREEIGATTKNLITKCKLTISILTSRQTNNTLSLAKNKKMILSSLKGFDIVNGLLRQYKYTGFSFFLYISRSTFFLQYILH